jgi:hypothetical protein
MNNNNNMLLISDYFSKLNKYQSKIKNYDNHKQKMYIEKVNQYTTLLTDAGFSNEMIQSGGSNIVKMLADKNSEVEKSVKALKIVDGYRVTHVDKLNKSIKELKMINNNIDNMS